MLGNSRIEQLYNQTMSMFEFELTDTRSQKLKELYEMSDGELPLSVLAPNSRFVHHGYCYTGGLLEYLDDLKTTIRALRKTYSDISLPITDINNNEVSDKNLMTLALISVIGKFGRGSLSYYIPTKKNYQIENGTHYLINPKLAYMSVSDNMFYLLNEKNIQLNETEYLLLKSINYDYTSEAKTYIDKFDFEYQLRGTVVNFMLEAVRIVYLKGKHKYESDYTKKANLIKGTPSVEPTPVATNLNSGGSTTEATLKKDTAFIKDLFGDVHTTSPTIDSSKLNPLVAKSEKNMNKVIDNKEKPKVSKQEQYMKAFDDIFGL